jgi:predicted AlkP superfamily pyrophosphatase or phosphodiesterase
LNNLSGTQIRPRYHEACFADLPETIQYWLTGEGRPALSPGILDGLPRRYDTIICFLVDAFGWCFVDEYLERYRFLQALGHDGRLSKITSQFPSTTAAHVTCIHTGLPVAQSGVYEWQYYEPLVDDVILPLLFSFAGTTRQDTLRSTGIDPETLYPNRTLYQDLERRGVASRIFMPKEVARSTYSTAVLAGADVKPFRTWSRALESLGLLLSRQTSPTYYFLYFGKIDSVCHLHGPNSRQLDAEIDAFLRTMERLLLRKPGRGRDKTLILLTADHGQIAVDPRKTIYLNVEARFTGLQRFLCTNRAGSLLVPGGSPRDVFLSIKDECLEDAQAFLARMLEGKADVYLTRMLIEQGLFGQTPPSTAFLSRVGNLVILPHPGETVWWYEKDRFEMKFRGHHGGLTPAEMEIPLFLYPIS